MSKSSPSPLTDVFSSIQSSRTTYGVVPFENSTYGTVLFTLDLLLDRSCQYPDLLVCGELYLPVHHCLVGRPSRSPPSKTTAIENPGINSIKKIYSHPAAFGQCEHFLSHHLPGVEKHEVSSTSKATEIVVAECSPTLPISSPSSTNQRTKSAAISSKLAAELHNLSILAEGIQDRDDNSTR
ncbi:MAG: hypothetical protein Q9218_006311, partial [Villophora microphyllina]